MNEISWVSLRRVVPRENMYRQYTVFVGRDLFGAFVVSCSWGRIGRPGQVRQLVCGTGAEAQVLAAQLVEKRRRRGYRDEADAFAPASALARLSPEAASPRRYQRTGDKAYRISQGKQLLLFAMPTSTMSQVRPPRAAPNDPREKPRAAGEVIPLMRSLGKPATPAERERALSLLTLAANLRGFALSRGGAALRPM